MKTNMKPKLRLLALLLLLAPPPALPALDFTYTITGGTVTIRPATVFLTSTQPHEPNRIA